MGLARGIFMVDTHVFVQASNLDDRNNVPMLLYHMDKHSIDRCVLKATVGMSNQFNADLVKQYPDRFIAICNDEHTQKKSQAGEEPWTIENAVKEISSWMETGQFAGIGEGLARDRTRRKKLISWDERLDQLCQLFDLGRKYKCPMVYHTGIPVGWMGNIDMARSRAHAEMADNGNPLLCHEIASLYPDVPIILGHAGVEASGYYMEDYEKCLNVAASHKNVFLETGMWWAELYDKPLKDPNIGAKKLVWGCAWGQFNNYQQWMPGQTPATYNAVNIMEGPATYQPDIWGWSLSELGRLNIPQDDMNLILGGNASWLYNIDTPQPSKRLFKAVDRGFDRA